MEKKHSFSLLQRLCFIIILCFIQFAPAAAQPLLTNSRWIVAAETGRRVKLACVNWASHLEVAVAEGLSKQPVDVISASIVDLGFNCVRLTWPIFLFTNDSIASLTVRESFNNLGLIESVAGIQANNPSIVDLTLISAFQAVVSSLGKYKVMIILDNHVSKPGWCCSNYDGNGFFGDIYFDPKIWIAGLTKVASMFKGTPNVVGMSLRNELRGPKQNVNDWYKYMQQGAEAVHAANPDVLVILSGLSFDVDLTFLKKKPVNLTFTGKLAFEVHRYSFTNDEQWGSGNPNKVCGQITNDIMSRGGFVLEQGYPLFVSEWGYNMRGTDQNANRFINCFLGLAAELDFDWALWTLVGSYYLREGTIGFDEYYGILTWNWCKPRNESFLQRISVVQSPFQGPGYVESRPHKLIFHPNTGLCIRRVSLFEPLELGSCSESSAWGYTPSKTITVEGTYFCLQADKLGKPAKLGMFCTDESSKWQVISDSRMHLASKLKDGSRVCLDVDSNNVVVTNACKCINNDSSCDPATQWFKIVNSTRGTDSKIEFHATSVLYFLVKKLYDSLFWF